MKKFLNEPRRFVDEMLEGILLAHPDQLAYAAGDRRCIVRDGRPVKGKVGIATGGGSGHLPLFLGYVGQGMLDGCSVGGVFQSPSAEQMLNVTKAINGGAGVLYIYGNYGGDIMNFDMAKDMAAMDDISVEQVVGAEDVASAPKGQEGKRRGVAGIFFLYKCAGAMADTLAPLAGGETHRGEGGRRTCGPWAWPSPRTSSRRSASRSSPSVRTRWRSGWASTGSRESAAAS